MAQSYFGSSLALYQEAQPELDTEVLSVNFNMELYGRGGADGDKDYGDTTVLIEFEQPRDWKYRDRTKDGVAGVGGAAGGPMVAHTTAWNRWDHS